MASAIADPLSTSFLGTEKYDFVIVGGGTSGLVVASRLSENPKVRVLVLEAGSNRLDDPRISTPGLAMSMYGDPDFDWNFMTTPQENLKGRTIVQPKGRTLGGSTAINMGMVIYPSKSGFDGWEKLGNKGWNWDTMSPYFRKFHTLTLPSQKVKDDLALDHLDPEIHGTTGPIKISFGGPETYTSFHKAWLKTFSNMKHNLSGDPISGVATGPFANPGTLDPVTKTRSHAGSEYLSKEVLERTNLCILTEVLVERLILKKFPSGKVVAQGVQVATKDGKHIDVPATTEVILAAGSIKTPQILELSGIGDPELLKANGINPVVANPNVGENLQDHGFVPFSWEVADDQSSGDMLRDPALTEAAMTAYLTAKTGPFSAFVMGSAFMPLVDFSKSEIDELLSKYIDFPYKNFPWQNDQYLHLQEMLNKPTDASGQYTMAPIQIVPRDGPSLQDIYGMGKEGNYFSIVSVLNHPFSRGFVHINSPDPAIQPTIDPQYLSHPLDLELHARHVLWLEKLAATEPLASLLKKGGRRIHAPKSVDDLNTAKNVVRETFISHYHVTSSCAMLPLERGGVVDEHLHVYGVEGLRIVDASVFPIIPRGNIQTSVYAVAEKAADIIKEDYAAGQVIQ